MAEAKKDAETTQEAPATEKDETGNVAGDPGGGGGSSDPPTSKPQGGGTRGQRDEKLA